MRVKAYAALRYPSDMLQSDFKATIVACLSDDDDFLDTLSDTYTVMPSFTPAKYALGLRRANCPRGLSPAETCQPAKPVPPTARQSRLL